MGVNTSVFRTISMGSVHKSCFGSSQRFSGIFLNSGEMISALPIRFVWWIKMIAKAAFVVASAKPLNINDIAIVIYIRSKAMGTSAFGTFETGFGAVIFKKVVFVLPHNLQCFVLSLYRLYHMYHLYQVYRLIHMIQAIHLICPPFPEHPFEASVP